MKIFFDIDGVIIDGWHADPKRRKPWDTTLEADLGVNREAFQAALFARKPDGSDALISRCTRGELDLKEVLADILPALGYSGSVEAFTAYWFRKDSNVNQQVIAAIEQLQRHDHVRLFLATNQDHHRAAYLWNELGLKDLFEDMFHSARMGVLKYDPAYFHAVGSALGIADDEAPLLFDDTERIVQTARDVGWDACLFDTVDDLRANPRVGKLLGSTVS